VTFHEGRLAFRGDRGRVPFSRVLLTDAAWRGSAALLRISATISASSEYLRGCVGMFPHTIARRPAKVWSELLRWLELMQRIADQSKNHRRIIANVAAIGTSKASASRTNLSIKS
jgi:hypothetical protein